MDKARNDLSAAVPKFCLALEEHRRTPDGRVRTSQELITSFFPHDDKSCTDRIFKYLPNDARGPIIAAWGIRGIKAALRDNDEKVQSVVHDALVAGDVDHTAFEDGLTPETLVRWVPLGDLWSFWRGGKLTKQAIHKALSTAYELYLFDARWFLDTIQAKGGAIKGTDVLADGLEKADLTAWVRRIHETGDGTPEGPRRRARLGQDRREDGERGPHRRPRRDGREGRARRGRREGASRGPGSTRSPSMPEPPSRVSASTKGATEAARATTRCARCRRRQPSAADGGSSPPGSHAARAARSRRRRGDQRRPRGRAPHLRPRASPHRRRARLRTTCSRRRRCASDRSRGRPRGRVRTSAAPGASARAASSADGPAQLSASMRSIGRRARRA